MKKILNFRLALILAIIMIISVVFATVIFVSEKSKMISIVTISVLLLIFLIIFALFKKKFLLNASVIFLIMLIPFVSICEKSYKINNNSKLNLETYNISGKISSVNKGYNDGKVTLILSDVVIGDDFNDVDFYGNLSVKLHTGNLDISKLEVGRFVSFNSSINFYSLQNYDYSFISKDICGFCDVYSYQFKLEEKISKNFRDIIKNSVYNKFSNTNTLFTSSGYAMLFGDSNVLNESVKGVFQGSGTAHLLAISGFHISLIVLIVSFVLDKLKTKNSLKFTIIAIILAFYCYICAFSVSIIRASIMAIISLLAVSRRKEYDILSSLSLAAFLILLINPLDLFNISFALSFISVLSIVCLQPILKGLFSNIFYNKFASSIALSLSVSLGLFFTQLYFFGSVPALSFLTNIVTIPIVSFSFIFLVCSIILSFIFPIGTALVNFYGLIMKVVLQFNNWISGINISFGLSNLGWIVLVLSIVEMFFISDFVLLNKKIKIPVALMLAIVMAVLVCV